MDRISDALEQAGRAREGALQASSNSDLSVNRAADVKDLIDLRLIRARSPFNQLPAREQERLIEGGEVIRFESGMRVFARGTEDPHVHYLIEGAVSIASETAQLQTLYAYQETALFPLDEAGVKSHTVTAVMPSRVFRIVQTKLDEHPPVPPPINVEKEVARELYSHTFSGEQLAQLVEQLHQDSQQLAGELDPSKGARALDEVRFGENTIGVRLDTPPADLAATITPPPVAPSPPQPEPPINPPTHAEINDEIGRFTRDLELRFRRYVQQVRAEERRRAQAQLQQHAKRLQALAEAQLRAKIETVRERYQAAVIAREQKLRERYEHLIAMANKITRQKAAIYQARRQLEDKLRLAEQVHHELAQIGLTVTRQLNDLENMIPDTEQPGAPT